MTQQPDALRLADWMENFNYPKMEESAAELRRLYEENERQKAASKTQRQWVGLTDEEMRELEKQFNAERVRTSDEEYLVIYPADYWDWQRAIEAKLKEKNT